MFDVVKRGVTGKLCDSPASFTNLANCRVAFEWRKKEPEPDSWKRHDDVSGMTRAKPGQAFEALRNMAGKAGSYPPNFNGVY